MWLLLPDPPCCCCCHWPLTVMPATPCCLAIRSTLCTPRQWLPWWMGASPGGRMASPSSGLPTRPSLSDSLRLPRAHSGALRLTEAHFGPESDPVNIQCGIRHGCQQLHIWSAGVQRAAAPQNEQWHHCCPKTTPAMPLCIQQAAASIHSRVIMRRGARRCERPSYPSQGIGI